MKNKSSGDSTFKKFIKENKSLAYMIPILCVLIIILVIMLSSGAFSNSPNESASKSQFPDGSDSIDTNQLQVEVLPQIVRPNDNGKVEISNDPFEAIMKLVGIVYSDSRSTAIIEWGDYSYIVQTNDKIGESDWVVTDITQDNITIGSNNDSAVLNLSDSTKGD